MPNLYRISVFFLLLIYSTPMFSNEEENLKFINWINETKNYLVNFKSVSGNFTQIDNIGNISKGTFWINERKEVAFYYSAPSETIIIYKEGSNFLQKQKITIFKPLVGEMVTTQEMAGFSISLLKTDQEIRKLWAAPSSAPYFHL